MRARRLRTPSTALVLGLLLAWVSLAIAGDDFRVQRLDTRLDDDRGYRLSAEIDYDFSAEALEALDNGVPLTVLIHIQVRRSGAWLWEDSLADLQLRRVIRYKPLSERYQVYTLPDTEGRSFVSREAALRALGELIDLRLLGAARLAPDSDYEVQLRTTLEIEALPLPLRPMAYLKPAWKLSSGWTKWPLQP
ncbi:DUF4390 domain-containing protein [Marichromatium gracile]|uniref:Uncharacterized protein DUF4390 n=1 Tax=Marichromatium gracile TaxID=1048 RepID=A0A4R4A6A9_MARGR|nr:DUF4390 domain-containing protein [Marichromatium gracile]MBK1708720.1 hypothetical protein [Marichromatium gracile]TCW34333.1 uncharacterized protein DUF4390 [Marichromatium gracile]